MGFFDKIKKLAKDAKKYEKVIKSVKGNKQIDKVIDKVKDAVDGKDSKKSSSSKSSSSTKTATSATSKNTNTSSVAQNNTSTSDKLKLANKTHVFEGTDYCDDAEYTVRYMIDDSFEEADSGAGEISMMSAYAADGDDSCDRPYVAIQNDNFVYDAVEAFKKNGTFPGAIDLVPLTGRFYFKAKKAYGSRMAYFYGLDRCDGFWVNNGLCAVYPKSYVGTPDETKMIQLLDSVAITYEEIKK